MITIGIAGGVASGKSLVARKLGDLGAVIIDGDRLGHQVLKHPDVIQAARDRWGAAVVTADGAIDRAAVARRVFGGDADATRELAYWEACTHPRITRRLKQRMAELSQQNGNGECVVVLDAPVMFKAGWDKLCDHLIFVDTPQEMRLQRALQRDGWTEQHFHDREESQLKTEEKKRRASFVIDNSGSLDKTYQQVLSFWNSLSRCHRVPNAGNPRIG